MKRLLLATAIAVVLTVAGAAFALSPTGPVTAAPLPTRTPIPRMWTSSAASAVITSCLSGNGGILDSVSAVAAPRPPGTKRISGNVYFCRHDGAARYVGLEFFTATTAQGVFIKVDGAFAEWAITIVRDWPTIRAMCISASPTDRLYCTAVHTDTAGGVTLSWIPVTDPRIKPAGAMYSCPGPSDPTLPWPDPTCATCV